MACRYCYIPFDGIQTNPAIWFRIIDQVVAWQCEAITFGGGDPMLYPKFRDLLEYCGQTPLFVHVDTNGLCVSKSDIDLIHRHVDLLGIPLDGSTAALHASMRGHSRHFEFVLRALRQANERGIAVKINTVVSKQNWHDLHNIAQMVTQHGAIRWSLYQFWPVGDAGKVNADSYRISRRKFLECTSELQKTCHSTTVEVGPIGGRHQSYFFVNDKGVAYTLDPNDASEYIVLGSIFDPKIIMKWNASADPEQNARRIGDRMMQARARGLRRHVIRVGSVQATQEQTMASQA